MDLRLSYLFFIHLAYAVQKLSLNQSTFPPNFMIGASTSAYQTEGAWNVDGRGESVWDFLLHTLPKPETAYTNGDVAANSYYLWQRDVEIAKEMGLDFYRFSISWSRILPDGFIYKINEKGVQYYNNLINGLLAEGIEPVVTMYHLDLPHKLQILGGWTHPNIVNWFLDYAKLLFSLYADRVKYWLTLNEPQIFCDAFYFTDYSPSLGAELVFASHYCTKHALLAHAMAYRFYQNAYKQKYNGLISYSTVFLWSEPENSTDPLDTIEVEMFHQFVVGRTLHPIFSSEGGWPPLAHVYSKRIGLSQGFNGSSLPLFTESEKRLVKGTADFIALNYYSGFKIKAVSYTDATTVIHKKITHDLDGAYLTPGLDHNTYPPGLRKTAAWMKKQYGSWDILVTENGYGDIDRTLTDDTRIKVIKETLEQVLLSMYEDDINYIGYSYWSMIDGFSFKNGYNITFGLWDVDFNDPERPRTARDSARYFTCITKNRQLEPCDYLVKEL
ncbi:myrosinase 1-like [Leptidea sinapis]|uniref:myrosinase 1-like n=1 Tax=Leptidea sinapis TaxID=189913 RepID=UPI002124F23C|nr:myrosinase 1-like [Leptidea sinapis]